MSLEGGGAMGGRLACTKTPTHTHTHRHTRSVVKVKRQPQANGKGQEKGYILAAFKSRSFRP